MHSSSAETSSGSIATKVAIEPDDVSALLECIDFVVAELKK